MSAGPNAKPLGADGWSNQGKPTPPWKMHKIKVRCQEPVCGWRGDVTELLAEDDDTTLWCPRCGLAAWEYE